MLENIEHIVCGVHLFTIYQYLSENEVKVSVSSLSAASKPYHHADNENTQIPSASVGVVDAEDCYNRW